jgi:hypothetical protein
LAKDRKVVRIGGYLRVMRLFHAPDSFFPTPAHLGSYRCGEKVEVSFDRVTTWPHRATVQAGRLLLQIELSG